MSLRDHAVERDNFTLDENRFSIIFPCCACIHVIEPPTCESCRECDHNPGAVQPAAKDAAP